MTSTATRRVRTAAAALALTAGLVGVAASSASAHECIIAKRSAQGNAGASNSANWYSLPAADLYASGHYVFGGDPLTEAQLAKAAELHEAAGLPDTFTVFERFTIPRSQTSDPVKSADGKGIDHFVAAYGDQLAEVFFAARAS